MTCLDVSDHEILVGSADNRVRMFDLRRGSIETDYVGGAVSSVSFTRDGQCYLVSCVSNTIKLFDKVSHITVTLNLTIGLNMKLSYHLVTPKILLWFEH